MPNYYITRKQTTDLSRFGINANDLGASPGNSGVGNYTAIQAALTAAHAAGGGVVDISTPGTYLLNGTLVIYSNTTLRGPGGRAVVIKNDPANTALRPMLVNSLVTPATGLGVAGTTVTLSSSGLTTTAAWTANGRSVNEYVAFAGASLETGYAGLFRVETAATNSLTVTTHEVPSSGTGTGTISAWQADTNIRVEGLTFDYNASALSGSDANTRHCIIFAHVYNPQFVNLRMENGSKYAIFPVNCRDMVARQIRFQTGSDGIHCGGISGAWIEDVSGYTGDDFLAFLSSEGTTLPYNLGTWHKFPHRHIRVFNARPHNSGAAFCKITGNDHAYRDFVFDGVYGSVSSHVFAIIEDATYHIGTPNIDSLKIFNCRLDSFGTTSAIVRYFASTDNTSGTIKRLELAKTAYVGRGGQILVSIGSGGTGTGTVNDLIVDDIEIDPTTQTTNTGGISINSKGVIGNAHVSRVRNIAGNANFVIYQLDGQTGRVYFNDITTFAGNGFVFKAASTLGANCDVFVNNCQLQSSNNSFSLANTGFTVNIFFSNTRAGNTTFVSGPGAGGTVNLYGAVTSVVAAPIAHPAGTMTNQMEKTIQSPTFAASYTPDFALGNIINVGTLTAGITVNNGTSTPANGTEVTFLFLEDGTGGWNVTWGTNYIFPTAWTNTGNTLGKKSQVTFRSNGTQMVAMGANSWF